MLRHGWAAFLTILGLPVVALVAPTVVSQEWYDDGLLAAEAPLWVAGSSMRRRAATSAAHP
jgi:hypothetical protein